jgi:hypothetical protein
MHLFRPAGSGLRLRAGAAAARRDLITCTVGEKLSSKIDAAGDPVVCSITRAAACPMG